MRSGIDQENKEEQTMKTCIIYHSYSGITRGVAEKVGSACTGDLIEVKPQEKYTTLTAYTLGCLRARNGECDPIDPGTIDVSAYDIVVIGTPVWAWKATPAVNAAIAALKGCEGKKAIIFATCGGMPGETLPILKRALEAKGATVLGDFVFTKKDIGNAKKENELIASVKAAGIAP
jgi:flavodoxin